MRTLATSVLLAGAIVSVGCGATRKVASTVAPGSAMTAATMTFIDRDHGKDAQSAVDVWLLRGSDEMAHLHSVGTKFDDHASIAPMTMQLSGALPSVSPWAALLGAAAPPPGPAAGAPLDPEAPTAAAPQS